MPFWRLYYHVVWSTKNRAPMITPEIEQPLYDYLIGKADSHGLIVHAIGGMPDHIHVVLSIPPKHSISDMVGQLKGSSSFHINHNMPGYELEFDWQRGFGVFSLGQTQLPKAVNYVRNQKEHHANHTTIPLLEKDDDVDDPPEKWKPDDKFD